MSTNFGQFTPSATPLVGQYAVGYDTAVPGGERRWIWGDIRTLMQANLGSAAFQNTSAFDSAGAAAAITKASIGLGSVENTALSTWAGSSNVTTLGTVTTGIWSATALSTSKGGVPTGGATNQVLAKNSASDYDLKWTTLGGGSGTVTNTAGNLTASALMVGNGTNDSKVLASLGTTTTVLHGNAAGLPTFSAVNLAADVTGTLPEANGGTGITALGTGIATFLGTPTSANLIAAVTNETGSGLLVFNTSPTFVTPILGTPTSGTVTNLTGTASININGTVGATTPNTVVGTTITDSKGELRLIPQNSQSSNYTLVLSDAGKHIYTSTASLTFTIPANSSVAFPIGTAITFVNYNNTYSQTISITTDFLYLAGVGTTGSRTLAPYGVTTAIKISSTIWIISGNGLT